MTRLFFGRPHFKWWKLLWTKGFPLNRDYIYFGQSKASIFRIWIRFSDTFSIETIVLAFFVPNVVNPNLHGGLEKDSGTLGSFK